MADFLSLLGGGGLDPASLGWLFANGVSPAQAGMVPPSDSDATAAAKDAASAALAAKMRQQSTDVAPGPGGDSFNDRFANAGWLMNQGQPNVPLPQPRPASAPQGGNPRPIANDLDNTILASQLPPNAAPTQGQAPPAAAAAPQQSSSGPSLMDRLAATFANFGAGGRQGGLFGALSGAMQGASTGLRMDPAGQMNQTVQALVNRGMAPDMAQILARDPQTLNQLLPVMMGIKPWQIQKRNVMGVDQLVAVNPLNPTESMVIKPPQQQQASPQAGSRPALVSQNGHVYQLQPNGSYQAIK